MDVSTAGVSSLSMLTPPDTLEEGVSIYQHEDFRSSHCVTSSGNAAALIISSSHTPRVWRLSPLPASLPSCSPGLRWSLVSDSRTHNILTRPIDKLPIARLFKTLWLWVQSSRLLPPQPSAAPIDNCFLLHYAILIWGMDCLLPPSVIEVLLKLQDLVMIQGHHKTMRDNFTIL